MKSLQILWRSLVNNDRESRSNAIVDALKENILFHSLSKRELRRLAKVLHHRSYHNGESVFRKGDRGFGLYIVIKGKIDILAESENNGQFLVTTLEPGNFFGEVALVDENCLRSATAVAAEATQLLGFFKPDLMEIIERHPETGSRILLQLSTVLGKRLNDLIDEWTKSQQGMKAA